ncbi:hypothetical protein [Colwellia sp. MEBiC06753]
MMLTRGLILVVISICAFNPFGALAYAEITVIKHVTALENNDPQKNFYLYILDLACKASEDKYGPCKLKTVEIPMQQERQLKSLNTGLLDITWTASTPQREHQAKAIKFPLMAGLLGYRIAVYNNKVKAQFTQSSSINDLKKLILVQGYDWPDTTILKSHQFNVQETNWYEYLYNDTAKGLYDYVLRGVFEVSSELKNYQSPNLAMDKNHLIVYPLNIYFFVAKHNDALAERIEYGLNKLNQNNNYLKLLVNYPPHKDSLPSLRLTQRKIHIIDDTKSVTEQNVRAMLEKVEQINTDNNSN